ncbi:MAG: hypothetical protein II851_02445 [Bacteroidales bacterium]|nr:hypothetical protein [Bacteroidales bacterium]
MNTLKITITQNNLHVSGSHLLYKVSFRDVFDAAREQAPGSEVWKRSYRSLGLEWATHNALYALGIARSRTADVDLNYPQKWYVRVAYAVVGTIVWPFIK